MSSTAFSGPVRTLLGVGFRPCARLPGAHAVVLFHPLQFTHIRAHQFIDTRCNGCVRACTCISGVYTFARSIMTHILRSEGFYLRHAGDFGSTALVPPVHDFVKIASILDMFER